MSTIPPVVPQPIPDATSPVIKLPSIRPKNMKEDIIKALRDKKPLLVKPTCESALFSSSSIGDGGGALKRNRSKSVSTRKNGSKRSRSKRAPKSKLTTSKVSSTLTSNDSSSISSSSSSTASSVISSVEVEESNSARRSGGVRIRIGPLGCCFIITVALFAVAGFCWFVKKLFF